MKRFLLSVVVLLSVFSIYCYDYIEYYFRVPFETKKEVINLNQLCSVDKVEANYAYCYANVDQFVKVGNKGYSIEVLTNPSKRGDIAMAKSVAEVREWDSFPTYDAYIATMNDFQSNNSAICEVSSFGQSVDNRELLVAKISDNVASDEDEPEIFFTGQIHGDEIVCGVLFLHLIDYLLDNYGTNDEITQLIDSTEIFINPISNPDGFWTNDNDTVTGATRYNANGVDMNRNYPTPTGVEHPDNEEWQPETQALMDFQNAHNFVFSTNTHSGIVVVNYPWDFWERLHPDDSWLEASSRGYADIVHENAPADYMTAYNNGITNGYAWYQTVGSRQDWTCWYTNCREITLELSDDKVIPANTLQDYWNYNRDAFLYWLNLGKQSIKGTVKNENDEPVAASITLVGVDTIIDNTAVQSNSNDGVFYRCQVPGTYNLEIKAPGYEVYELNDVTINSDQTTEVEIILTAAAIVEFSGKVVDYNNEIVNGATIELIGDATFTATSDAMGLFNIENAFAGTYKLKVSADGYATGSQEVILSADQTELLLKLYEPNIETFESGLPTEFAGDWEIDNSGYNSSSSLNTGSTNDGATKTVSYSTVGNVQGSIGFWIKVSTEENYDFARFYIDNVEQQAWSGEVEWTYYEYNIDNAQHSFTWKYIKDSGYTGGSDEVWLDDVNLPSSHAVGNEDNQVNAVDDLHIKCYPNPFNPEITISYYISDKLANSNVNIDVYNIKGQKVINLLNKPQNSGNHNIIWKGYDDNNQRVASGVYFVKVKSNNQEKTRKIVLLK